ncbi:MAG TPA: amino acid adenylation domain-containing protein, partial [Pyrinomonadaceae bacterium]
MGNETLKGVRLSPQQRRVWLLQQENAVYNAACALRLEGELRVERLREALRGVAERHQILRTNFRRRPGTRLPIQVVAEEGGVAWREFDWSDRDAPRRRDDVAAEFRAQLAAPAGLEDGRPFRATLLKCSPREHALILCLPALCADERTLDNLAREVAEAYGGAEADEDPVQYAQYAKWQNALAEDEDGAAGRDYWQKRLPPDSEPPLPFERRPAAETAFRPASLSTAVDPQVAARLARIAVGQQTSTEALLLTCWGVLLWRHTGEPDVSVRAAFAGRGYEELETACGLFAKHIPVPARLKDGLPFHAALAETAESLAEAAEWQEFYTWELEAAAQESSAPPTARAFGFDYRQRPAEISAAGLVFRTLAQAAYGERFKLRLSCVEQGGELLAEFHYDESLFDAGDVRRLAGRFHELLSGVAREPGALVNRLNVLGEAERRELLFDFNRTAADYPRGACLHQLFEEQARRTPERVAVAHEGDALTYAELNARANRLARHLRGLGVGPETTVGLLMERSANAFVALLGILKAGGAYVPLDPSYPRERVAGMLSRGVVKLLLTQQSLSAGLRLSGLPVLALDAEWPRIEGQSAEDLPNLAAAENLAYVIHTSGSTGTPKGVCVEHRQLLNYLHGVRERLQLDEGASYATVSTIAADLGYTAVFPSLCGGGTLHVLSLERASDADALAAYFEAHPVDCLKIVPSHLAALLNTATRPEQVLPRRRLVVGGEASHWELVDRVAEYAPGCRVLNHYGPTETTVGVLTYEAGEARERGGASVPLGRPLGNSRVYVLDAEMQPAPVGMAGEVYVGGAGVARGYLQQPGLTAERFLPDPFSQEPGARLYRTGDLARHLAGGDVEFLGRADDQVKIRGFRIELGEIEAALKEHPSVREAVLVARDDERQQKSLVAYVVPREGGEEGVDGARLHTLPNDLSVFHLNRNEADHVYREIFEDRLYLKHGITLRDGDCVFDVGANIGLFTLFAEQQCRDLSVYAFEPNPAAFDKLRRNVERYGLKARLFERGVSNRVASATYTFYPQASVMSGFYPDLAEEKRLFKNFMLNQQLEAAASDRALLAEYADELTDDRFESRAFECRLTTVSDFIREQGVGRIDLLKVDVEKSEVDVLEGIAEEDWPKIRQVVIEVHDIGERVENVLRLLTGHGFSIEQDELVEGTGVYNIFARRAGAEADGDGGRGSTRQPLQVVNDFSLTSGALRAYLLRTLPEYMLPSAFVLLERLPRTPNGKVDRKALPAPEQARAESAGDYVAPRTPTEEIVAGIWAQVLRAERVGVDDNFFELGGHSLLATQVISRIRQVFRVEVGLRSLFKDATVAGLSKAVEVAQAAGRGVEAPPLRPVARDGELPLSFAQQRLWFLDQLEGGGVAYNIPVAVRLLGELDAAALSAALGEVVRRHEVLRTTFSAGEGQPAQVVAPASEVPLPSLDLTALPAARREAEASRLAALEARRPFDLARGPLLRATLLRLGEREHVALLNTHHIVSDGWSRGVLVGELGKLYDAFSRREPSPLAELPIQYADYAVWQREWLQGDVLEEQLSYWKGRLEGLPAVIDLPTDRPRPPVQTSNGATHSFALPAQLSERLRALCLEEGATPFMVLLAAFDVLLYRYTGQTSLAVGTPIAGRNRAETERLIGLFINTLVLRADVSPAESFKALLGKVKEACLGAYAHQDIPFERLVDELKVERSLSHTPLFQVMFILQNAPEGALDLRGLRLEPFGGDPGVAKFDLTLAVTEGDGTFNCAFGYNTDLFDEATARRMSGHFH